MFVLFITLLLINEAFSEVTLKDLEFLNELPLDKLLRLKTSLQELVPTKYDNSSLPDQSHIQRFGAEAMAVRAPPIKRTDYDDELQKKGGHNKISSIFSMSVTTLAFLAFGGYLLCLIVQAVKSKQGYNTMPAQPPTFFISTAGLKKRPQTQFTSYGRRRRESRAFEKVVDVKSNLTSEELFSALVQLCEGYARWNMRHGDF